MDTELLGDSLHRLAKIAIDSGEAATVEDALQIFSAYRLHVAAGPSLARSPAQQAALLTLVNAGRRSFLGGVTIGLPNDMPLRVAVPGCTTIAEAVIEQGGQLDVGPRAGALCLVVGDAQTSPGCAASLKLAMSGWRAACFPLGSAMMEDRDDAFVLTGVAAAGLAMAEAFQYLRASNPAAGRRACGISLWNPASDWRLPGDDAIFNRLPAAAWLIGLGNLGQACLWSLGLLPYADPSRLDLILQDFDRIAPSNESTSMLTRLSDVGRFKTRAMAEWAERRGFAPRLVERRFDSHLRLAPEDPSVALCGVDNALARAALEGAGFGRIIEAGLGNGASDFLALRLHSFPASRTAQAIWAHAPAATPDFLDRPAYRDLAARGADRCGLVRLAGRMVGAPFVGALAGALVVSELVKLANGGPNIAVLDMHLRTPDRAAAVLQGADFAYNPGTTALAE